MNYQEENDLKIDMARDHHNLIELVMDADETGIIILGNDRGDG